MKFKLTNTWKHASIGGNIGLIAVPISFAPTLAAFVAVAVALLMLGWENAQYQRQKQAWIDMLKRAMQTDMQLPEFRAQYNWVDSIVDWLAGYACFSIAYWLIILIAR